MKKNTPNTRLAELLQKVGALARATHNEIGDYFLCRCATQKNNHQISYKEEFWIRII
jgi:hypothetical protein